MDTEAREVLIQYAIRNRDATPDGPEDVCIYASNQSWLSPDADLCWDWVALPGWRVESRDISLALSLQYDTGDIYLWHMALCVDAALHDFLGIKRPSWDDYPFPTLESDPNASVSTIEEFLRLIGTLFGEEAMHRTGTDFFGGLHAYRAWWFEWVDMNEDSETYTDSCGNDWHIYHFSGAGQPDAHPIEEGEWFFEPADSDGWEVYSPGYATMEACVEACQRWADENQCTEE